MKSKRIEENGHILAVINGKQVEMKFCTYCKRWHPIYEFYHHVHVKKDNLNCWCKSCMEKQNKLHKKEILLKEYNECMLNLNILKDKIEKLENSIK